MGNANDMTLQEAQKIARTDSKIYGIKQNNTTKEITFITVADHVNELKESKKVLSLIVDTANANDPRTLQAYHQLRSISAELNVYRVKALIAKNEYKMYGSRSSYDFDRYEKIVMKYRKELFKIKKT